MRFQCFPPFFRFVFLVAALAESLDGPSECVVDSDGNCDAKDHPKEEEESLNPVRNNKADDDDADRNSTILQEDATTCGVYFASSSLPGAGNGLFAGHDFFKGDQVIPGDLSVTITDLAFHSFLGKDELDDQFLWNEYTWASDIIEGMDGEATRVDVGSFGIGAAINCDFGLENVDTSEGQMSPSGKTWSPEAPMGEHPGVGAFTIFHDRQTVAYQDIPAGMELFLSYGEEYFSSRDYNDVPLTEHFKRGTSLLKIFNSLLKRLGTDKSESPPPWMNDLYNFVRHEMDEVWGGATLKTWPDTMDRVDEVLGLGIRSAHAHKSIRSMEMLQTVGSCADHLEAQPSTLPHAGRGAFTRRRIAKGATVAPVPLIHIPNRSIFDMYEPLVPGYYPKPAKIDFRNVTDVPVHRQLLLNYCFGHADTDVLLCPYGVGTALINHSKEKANAKIVWSTKHTTHPEWLDMKPAEWTASSSAGLAWEFVATRDLAQGEEVFLDYGDEWEEAWSEHVANWIHPTTSSCLPISAETLNEYNEDLIVPTWSEGYLSFSTLNNDFCDTASIPLRHFPEVRCHNAFLDMWGLTYFAFREWDDSYPCRALDRYLDTETDTLVYTVELFEPLEMDKTRSKCEESFEGIMFKVPGDIFHFVDRPYTQDSAQPWSFRHDMRIPDELLPNAWRRAAEETAS